MRIDGSIPYFSTFPPGALNTAQAAGLYRAASLNFGQGSVPASGQESGNWRGGQGVFVDISPAAWDAYRQSAGGKFAVDAEPKDDGLGIYARPKGGGQVTVGDSKGSSALDQTECQTCASRKYQDVSDDSSVSFQAPTHMSPGQAATGVASHEREHVFNERVKAEEEGRRIISQSVTIQTAVCPECNRVYVSGGVTRTITAKDNSSQKLDQQPRPEA